MGEKDGSRLGRFPSSLFSEKHVIHLSQAARRRTRRVLSTANKPRLTLVNMQHVRKQLKQQWMIEAHISNQMFFEL